MNYLQIFVEHYIWKITAISTAFSFMVFLALMLYKCLTYPRLEQERLRKQEIRKNLLIHLSSPLKNIKKIIIKSFSDLMLTAELAPSILQNLKGNSYNQLLDTFETVDVFEWAFRTLDSSDAKKKVIAINLIAHYQNKETKEKLKSLLMDQNEFVQHASMEALAHSQDKKLLPMIINKFKSQESLSPLLMADIFQKFGKDISNELASHLKSSRMPNRIKIAMIMALMHIGDKNLVHEVALKLYNSQNKDLRALAFNALAESKQIVDMKILLYGAKDQDWRVRQYVARCAVHLDPIPLDILDILIKDENWLVAMHSGQTLLKSGPGGIKLLELLTKQDSIAGGRAKMILDEKGILEGGNGRTY